MVKVPSSAFDQIDKVFKLKENNNSLDNLSPDLDTSEAEPLTTIEDNSIEPNDQSDKKIIDLILPSKD